MFDVMGCFLVFPGDEENVSDRDELSKNEVEK